jgi:hypothetical protein
MTTYLSSISVPQCRAARALLSWNAEELAAAAHVGVATVRRFEGGATIAGDSLATIRYALEQAGVVFLSAGENAEGGAGVRLRSA